MSPILDATSLLPTGMVFDIVADMMVDRFHEMWLFMFRINFEASGTTCDW